MYFRPLIISMRPRQWIKNLILFAGIIFARELDNPVFLLRTVEAFILFCLVSGGIYIFNDLFDYEKDKQHPRKRLRPIAAGEVPLQIAFLFATMLVTSAALLSILLEFTFGICILIYIIMMLAYSKGLKKLVILDILIISIGFVLRAYSGTVVNPGIQVSPWLLACTFFLAMFLALCKRRHELIFLDKAANTHREVLEEYSPEFLDQMIAIVTSSTVVSYALYTLSEETMRKFGTKTLILTFPFVIYGILRYLYLAYRKGEGGEPENLLLTDKPTIINILLWAVVVILAVYSPFKLDLILHIGGY